MIESDHEIIESDHEIIGKIISYGIQKININNINLIIFNIIIKYLSS